MNIIPMADLINEISEIVTLLPLYFFNKNHEFVSFYGLEPSFFLRVALSDNFWIRPCILQVSTVYMYMYFTFK